MAAGQGGSPWQALSQWPLPRALLSDGVTHRAKQMPAGGLKRCSVITLHPGGAGDNRVIGDLSGFYFTCCN